MRHWLVYMTLLIMPLTLTAQEPDTVPLRKGRPAELSQTAADSIAAPMAGNQPAAPSDNIPEAAAVRQRLLAARERDTTYPKVSKQWTLSADFTTEINLPLDTTFSLFSRYRATDRFSDFNAFLGNYGLPLYQINFFDRDWNPDRFLNSYYLPFMHTPANTLFINTHVPFTELKWSNAGGRSKAEQTFRIRHSQNINRFLNFGLIFDIVYSFGQYNFQKAIDKNFLLHGSYNGNAYTAYLSAGINNHESEESGGLVNKDDLSLYTPENIPFVLNDLNKARSRVNNRYIMLVQRYSPGGKRDTITGDVIRTGPITFSYVGSYEWNKRRYLDDYPMSVLYDTVMISNSVTEDSLHQGLLSNTVRVDFAAGSTGRFRIGAGAGVRSELRNFVQVMPGDSLTKQDTVKRNMNSLVLTGKVFNNIGTKFGWSASGDLWFQGYRAGDFIVDGRIYKDFATANKGMITWDATGSLASYTPSFWYYTWGSNNFAWQLDHDREFRLTAGSSLLWPDRNMNLSFNYALVDNFMYMGSDAIPAQHQGALSVLSLSVRKDLIFWKMHFDNTVLLQQSSNNDVLSLPLATARSALFFDHLFKFAATGGEMNFQIGGEAMIHTQYNAMNYMPATGRYFNQSESETGNYPFINVFLNLKIKRTRIFLMVDHLNSGWTGYEYFLVPNYPLNIRMFRYGIAWTFYD